MYFNITEQKIKIDNYLFTEISQLNKKLNIFRTNIWNNKFKNKNILLLWQIILNTSECIWLAI